MGYSAETIRLSQLSVNFFYEPGGLGRSRRPCPLCSPSRLNLRLTPCYHSTRDRRKRFFHMLVYLVRHAHSLANAGGERGLNSALSPLGALQVGALVRRFARTEFTAVYSSPFRRCLATALPMAA